MRKAVWMVVLLLAPLATGLTPELPGETHPPAEGEHVLVLHEGVWTSQRWAMLEDQGVQPLRTLRPDALLVWADEAGISWPSWVTAEPSEVAQFRAPLASESTPQHYRVLLEPRLPSSGIEAVQSTLTDHGLPIHSASLDVGGNLPGSFTVHAPNAMALQPLLQTDGVLWIEPVLTTKARNAQASALMEAGTLDYHPFWSLGLNASGVVFGVADSGIDADHACFRNATSPTSPHAESGAAYPAVGVFGEEHRKILHLNTSVDGNDAPGHSDYRHGTHVIGSLACHEVDNFREGQAPSNGSTLAHGSTLVIQDIVSADGWAPPPVDQLLWESSSLGGVIHSNSWGDDTTAYTERTGRFDAYAKAMPWSMAFIAPGNGGEGVLEPANGRNVVAVSASTKSLQGERWGSTAYGPTEAGTDGIFVLAPGTSIQSAGGDGFWDTNNGNLRSSSGTSMATPLAAGAAGIIQQLYEGGWIVPAGENLSTRKFSGIQPAWVEDVRTDSVRLGDGFTPSGSLIRASLAMAASPLSENVRNGGNGGHALHNPYDGWGALNLSQLFDPTTLVQQKTPSHDQWVHDSFQLKSGTVDDWFAAYGGETSNLSGMLANPWYGNESIGPFLQTGDVFTQRLIPLDGEHVRIRLAYPAQPEPAMVDDLQLRIRLEDGTILLSDELREGEDAPTKFYPGVVDTNNTTAFPPSNETVHGIDIPWSYLSNSSYIDVDVVARFVQPGGSAGAVGLDGDSVGFSLLVKGVDRNSGDNLDDDGDGIRNKDDACPNQAVFDYWDDTNGDGCLDDFDNDGVPNTEDMCPGETAHPQWDPDRDGCLDDDDGDGVPNIRDICPTEMAAAQDDVDRDGCIDETPGDWKLAIRNNHGCSYCYAEIASVEVRVDGAVVHQNPTIDMNIEKGGVWEHELTREEGFANESFSEVELLVEMKFIHSYSYTSGRQDMCWFFGTCGSSYYAPPTVLWNFHFEFITPQVIWADERRVTISSEKYVMSDQSVTHSFTWSKNATVDEDGDGYTQPGVTYNGTCGVDIPHSYYQPGRAKSYDCQVHRNGMNDAFPYEPNQWVDSDGDGYGDNSDAVYGDAFPNNPGQWSDEDGDGFGDNVLSGGWDDCPYRWGNSTNNLQGCPDGDGDGFSDICGFQWCGAESAWGPNGYHYARGDTTDSCPDVPGKSYETRYGCPDGDGDGWADPSPTSEVGVSDACPNEFGLATSEKWRGCPDSDGDGWADVEDDLPYDSDYHLDRDGDGVPDEEDDFPQNPFLSSDEEFEMTCCFGLCFGLPAFLMFLTQRRRTERVAKVVEFETKESDTQSNVESVPKTKVPEPIVVGQLKEEDLPEERDTFW